MADLTSLPDPETGAQDLWQIWSLCFARGLTRRVHDNFIHRDMHDGPMPIDFNLWILRNRHRVLLVDTGFGPEAAARRGRPLDFDPVEGLARIGIPPESVTDVLLTHLHYDHAGNIDRFPNARFHIQDGEVAFATGRCMCEAHLRFPFDVEDVVALVRRIYADRVTFHDREAAPFPGITLHALPGHSAAVQGVRVRTARGPVFLASDISHYFANLLTMKPFSIILSVPETLTSYRKALDLAGGVEHLIPGHDPKIRRHYPGVIVNGVTLHALHLPPEGMTEDVMKRTDDF